MKIDFDKRRRVMERSQLLGHCICDVRRPCPCDVFRDDGICPCAGERPDPVDSAQIKLMQWVHNAGCASKIAPADLDAAIDIGAGEKASLVATADAEIVTVVPSSPGELITQ